MMNKAILVVDDDVHMLTLLEAMLKRQGYAVIKAQNAELALHLVKSLSPNLFILDVMMPGMNGFELCRRLRTIPHTADTPVIILTALNNSRSKKTASDVGANAFVHKEALSNWLLKEVHALLNDEVMEYQ